MASLSPEYNSGGSHYLAPADYAAIYDIGPLYAAGIDGTGQAIAVVGQSNVLLSDIETFRNRNGLPANDPKLIPYTGTPPGFNGSQIEGNLDLEWAGAIAPKATISYVYGPNALAAVVYAVTSNTAPIITVSYGNCEIFSPGAYYRSIGQQASAQGITILSATGDSGAAGCDAAGAEPFATRGQMANFPAVLPEFTGVGGTEFSEGTGTYWASGNSANLGSALGYIPEVAWNESVSYLLSGGGGASIFFPRPFWQTGPGVPADQARHVPDLALSSAAHDPYLVTYEGVTIAVAGTSAAAPSLAGIVALLNQYQVSQGNLAAPGLGNINPQLYRLAQAVPAAFHDITSGNNIVPCAQGSPDCLTGSFGYAAGPAYDMATGLGSIDANVLVTQWNTAAARVTVVLQCPSQATLDDTVTAAVTVYGRPGGPQGTPTGSVDFSINGIALGSAPLGPDGTGSLTFPMYKIGLGTVTLTASYPGDGVFSGGAATQQIKITVPTSGSAVVVSGPIAVWATSANVDAQGPSWQTPLTLHNYTNVPAEITGFSIDGQPQNLSQYFPSAAIPAGGTIQTQVTFRNIATPVTRTFGFTGVDSTGQTWSRQLSVNYYSSLPRPEFYLSATPLTVAQNLGADSSCQWAARIRVDEISGYASSIANLFAGNLSLAPQIPAIFGTTRLEAWGSLEGTVCFSGITPPASDYIEVGLSSGLAQEVAVSFTEPPANALTLSATPANLKLTAPVGGRSAVATLAVGISDKTAPWSAAVFPANRTTAWLSV
ncbi:MAG: Ig-like domain repeat protein, partial [Acidobacteriia bacterium]|nr:Ig-like domain repeat protein [Terriglobia bacterium]